MTTAKEKLQQTKDKKNYPTEKLKRYYYGKVETNKSKNGKA